MAAAALPPRLRRRPSAEHESGQAWVPVMGDWILGGLALMLVMEGLMPFLSPTLWRQMFERALRLSDGQIRFIGLSSMLAGLLLLALLH